MPNDTETTVQDAPSPAVEPRVALEELIEFKKERVRGDMTPCPSCTLLVHIAAKRCPHCGSDITANNALVRETLRHIKEIAAQLDREHRVRVSLSNRIKRLFSTRPAPEAGTTDTPVERVLENLSPGDPLTVRSVDGAWLCVETGDGQKGWLYRTPAGKP